MRRIAGAVIGSMLAACVFTGCFLWRHEEAEEACVCRPWYEILGSDTLRVVTVPGSYTAYSYRQGWSGYEYEQARRLARHMDLKLQVITAPGEQAMLDSLRSGAADLAITRVSKTVAEADQCVRPCGPRMTSGLSLVSVRRLKYSEADTALYTLAAFAGSRSLAWVPTAFQIDTLPADTFNVDHLVDLIQDGEWDACLLEEPVAQMFRNYYPSIRVSDTLAGTVDTLAWMVSVKADTLRAIIDTLLADVNIGTPHYTLTEKRSYERSLGRKGHKRVVMSKGQLSVYDHYFRTAAAAIGWDWRLLAAIGYNESHFEPSAEHKGARGVMQLVGRTASALGYTESDLDNPELNIEAGAKLVAYLEGCLRSKILKTCFPELREQGASAATPEQLAVVEKDLVKFTLAAYNAGMGHVYDAIELADALGYEPAVWDYNVGHCLQLKAEPEYYTMPCVSAGKFNGNFTCNYVRRVLETYDDFREQTAP